MYEYENIKHPLVSCASEWRTACGTSGVAEHNSYAHVCVLKHLSTYRRYELKNAPDDHRWIEILLNGLQRWFSRSSSSSDFPPFHGHDHRRRNHGPWTSPEKRTIETSLSQENAQNHERDFACWMSPTLYSPRQVMARKKNTQWKESCATVL